MPETKLGRFGVGIKYNACSAADRIEVDSASIDGNMNAKVDWSSVIKSGRWAIAKPKWSTIVLVSRGTGTTITLSKLRWDRPREKHVDGARHDLTEMFYPAIADGKRIVLNHVPLTKLDDPKMRDVIEGWVYVRDGKGAHVRAGILLDPGSSLYQVHVTYKHRVIKPRSTFGCGSYSGLRSMFARVTLTADWELTRFKDDLADSDAEALETQILEFITPILEQCHSAKMDAHVDEIIEALNASLPDELRARPQRRKQPSPQIHKPRPPRKREDHGHTDRDPADTGPARMPASKTLTIDFDQPLSEEFGLGHFISGRPNRVTLSRDNPFIAAHLAHRDMGLSIETLRTVALMIYQHAKDTAPGQVGLFDRERSFGRRVYDLAEKQPQTGVRNGETQKGEG